MFVITKTTDTNGVFYNFFDFKNAINQKALERFYNDFAVGDQILGMVSEVSESQKRDPRSYFYEWSETVNEDGEDEWDWHSYDPFTELTA